MASVIGANCRFGIRHIVYYNGARKRSAHRRYPGAGPSAKKQTAGRSRTRGAAGFGVCLGRLVHELTHEALAEAAAIPLRTVQRRRNSSPRRLHRDESDRLARIARLYAFAETVLRSREAAEGGCARQTGPSMVRARSRCSILKSPREKSKTRPVAFKTASLRSRGRVRLFRSLSVVFGDGLPSLFR